jgi:hypothetical protein
MAYGKTVLPGFVWTEVFDRVTEAVRATVGGRGVRDVPAGRSGIASLTL